LNNLKEYKWNLVLDKFSDYKSDYIDFVNNYIIDNGLQDRIVFIDPTHNEMGQFINAVDVVVIPSLSTNYWIEQYGRIAAESLACGKIVISSKTGTLPLLIKEYGVMHLMIGLDLK
jgi:glycosyltransferase involved in cell wall biosynthesis